MRRAFPAVVLVVRLHGLDWWILTSQRSASARLSEYDRFVRDLIWTWESRVREKERRWGTPIASSFLASRIDANRKLRNVRSSRIDELPKFGLRKCPCRGKFYLLLSDASPFFRSIQPISNFLQLRVRENDHRERDTVLFTVNLARRIAPPRRACHLLYSLVVRRIKDLNHLFVSVDTLSVRV